MSTVFHVVLLAVVAGASPLALTTTLAVIEGDRPVADGIGFAAGYVIGTTVACAVGLVAGAAFVDRIDSHGTIEAMAELLAGGALVAVGATAARSEPAPEKTGRGTAIMRGLHETGPAAAFSMSALIGFGGPKRLLFTVLAMTAISSAGGGPVTSTTLVVAYVVVATALVWAPVSFVILRAAEPNRLGTLRVVGRGSRSWVASLALAHPR